MAKNIEATEAATTESDAAAAARAEIANRPRQSVVRFVEHYVTIRETEPELLEEFFGDQVDTLEAASAKVRNPIADAIEKATTEQKDRSIKALENEDEKNGYAHYVFDQELFDEKTREKKTRTKKSVTDKVQDALEGASDEDLAALKELLAARGL